MFINPGPLHFATGVLVGNEIVGAIVTKPCAVGAGPGEAVHVGGKDCGAKVGNDGPKGCAATVW